MAVKVTIPLRSGIVVELNGEPDTVKETVQEMNGLFRALEDMPSSVVGQAARTLVSDLGTGIAARPNGDAPVIPADRKKTLRDSIVYLLSTEWGRAARSFGEIYEALKVNAIFRSKGSVGGTLTQLVNQNRIRRTRDNPRDEWRYCTEAAG